MLQPKQSKFRKQHKGRNRGLSQRGDRVSFGEYGLKALSSGADDFAADRGGAARFDPQHSPRRQSLDPGFSRQAGHPKTA